MAQHYPKTKNRNTFKAYIMLLPYVIIVVFFLILPIFSVLEKSIHIQGPNFTILKTFTLDNYIKIFNRQYLPIFVRSLSYAGITTILCFIIGYPLAYYIAVYGGKRKNIFLFLIMLPFWTSYLIRTFAWMTLLRSEGIINVILKNIGLISESIHFLNTPFSVILGLTYGFLPFMTLPLYVSLEKVDLSLVDASLDLGASPLNAFLTIIFPLSLPGIIAGSLLTFIPCVGDFVVSDILGGPKTIMIGNIIQQQYLVNFNWPFGSALSFVLTIAMLLFIFLYIRIMGANKIY